MQEVSNKYKEEADDVDYLAINSTEEKKHNKQPCRY